MNKWLIALLISGVLAAGCGKKEEGGEGTPAASGEEIGVAECDDYMKKVQACLAKAPPENKQAMESALKANHKAWSDLAKTPTNKGPLTTGCKAALDAFISANPNCT